MLKSCLKKSVLEAGCDEAGRGCLAGPVFAAAVILPSNYKNKWLNDSKKLSDRLRYDLRPEIEALSLAHAVASVSPKEIDQINILNASILGMHKAIDILKLRPEHLIIDGNRFKPYQTIPHQCLIKGDAKYLSIAAASVLAKTYRDDYMKAMAEKYPQYAWEKNMGYPTRLHREAIRIHGATELHRLSFQLLPAQLALTF